MMAPGKVEGSFTERCNQLPITCYLEQCVTWKILITIHLYPRAFSDRGLLKALFFMQGAQKPVFWGAVQDHCSEKVFFSGARMRPKIAATMLAAILSWGKKNQMSLFSRTVDGYVVINLTTYSAPWHWPVPIMHVDKLRSLRVEGNPLFPHILLLLLVWAGEYLQGQNSLQQ